MGKLGDDFLKLLEDLKENREADRAIAFRIRRALNKLEPTGELLDRSVLSRLATAEQDIDDLETPESWTAVTHTNSWVDYSASYPTKYMKDGSGVVHLRGVVKDGTVDASAFTLPAGYRPTQGQLIFAVMSNATIGRLNIETDGTVVPATPCNNAWVSVYVSFHTTS